MRRPVLLVSAALIAAATLTSTGPTATSAAVPAGYRPLPSPQRLVDTRAGQSTVDGGYAGIGLRAAGSTTEVDVAGRAGLAPSLGSVVLNLTVDEPGAAGFLTVWPCDQDRPTASNLNHSASQTVAVAAISKVDSDGAVCVYTLAATHLIIDVAGDFPTGGFEPLDRPERLADTRAGESTVDGRFAGAGIRPANQAYEVRVAGRGTVPSGATAVALNVTATTVSDAGFLTVYPCDSTRPTASNVNYEPGSTTPNLVLTRLDPDGDVCIYTLQPVDLVVDVSGSFDGDVFEPLPEPRRLLDSRVGEETFDGTFEGGGIQQDGATLQLPVAGRADIPAEATAVVLNVTSTQAAGPGFVTVHPQGSQLPTSSNVNVAAGRTVANLVIASLGPTGDACLFTRTATHLVVDVAGWLSGPVPSTAVASCPTRRAPDAAETYRIEHVRRPVIHRVVGHDAVAVYICKIPTNSTGFDGTRQHSTTDVDFADFANAEVAPYFAEASGGSYTVEFIANGTIQAGRHAGPNECIDAAVDRTGAPFNNVLVADSTLSGGGFASPGTIFSSDFGPDFTVFDRTPDVAGRGGWVGGSVISERPNPGTLVHEIGHTVHWPHSYVGPFDEYDNPVDVMSEGFGWCRTGTMSYPCDPGSTLAFNRFASGWLGNGQVISHPSGTTNYVIDRPNGSGMQLIVAPDPSQPHGMLTIEARPAVDNDDFLEVEGVALHVVDQTNRFGGLSGLSTSRFHRQAVGSGDTYDHVIETGDTLTVHGLTITVLRRVGDRFEIRIAGTYRPPAASFFTE